MKMTIMMVGVMQMKMTVVAILLIPGPPQPIPMVMGNAIYLIQTMMGMGMMTPTIASLSTAQNGQTWMAME